MKIQNYLFICVVFGGVACAGSPKVPRDARSENFEVTSRYLDLGGDVYAYMDVEGDIEAAAALVNEAVQVVDEIPAEYKSRLDAVQIARKLGLTDVSAVGMSSYKDGNRFINKSFVKTVYPRTGLMQYFGGEPHPLEVLQLAPANSAFAFEGDINLKALLETMYAIFHDVAQEDMLREVDAHLDSPVVPGSITFRELISRLDTRMMGAIAMHPTRKMKIPDTEVEIPYFDVVLSVDNMGFLMDILVKKAKEVPVFSVWEDAQWQRIGVAEFLTQELLNYRPVIWRHKGSQRVYIATSAEFLEERLLLQNGLNTSPEFLELSANMPLESGNGFMYVSPEVFRFVKRTADDILTKESADDPELKSVQKVANLLLSKVSPGWVWMSQNTQDGIYQVSSSMFSHKLTLLGSIYMNQLYGISMLGVASNYVFGSAAGNLLGLGDNTYSGEYGMDAPVSPEQYYQDEQQEAVPESELGPGEGEGPAEQLPEYVDKFKKQWSKDHPGDSI